MFTVPPKTFPSSRITSPAWRPTCIGSSVSALTALGSAARHDRLRRGLNMTPAHRRPVSFLQPPSHRCRASHPAGAVERARGIPESRVAHPFGQGGGISDIGEQNDRRARRYRFRHSRRSRMPRQEARAEDAHRRKHIGRRHRRRSTFQRDKLRVRYRSREIADGLDWNKAKFTATPGLVPDTLISGKAGRSHPNHALPP